MQAVHCYDAYGYEEAIEYFKRALEALDLGIDDRPLRFSCTRSLALAQSVTDVATALTTSLNAISLARLIADPHTLALAALMQEAIHGRANQIVGDDADRKGFTLRLIEEALHLLPVENDEMAVWLLNALARCAADSSDEAKPRGLSASREAVERARRVGQPELLAHALTARHSVLRLSGPSAIAERVAISAELAAIPVEGGRVTLLGAQIDDCFVLGDMNRARDLTREFAVICESRCVPNVLQVLAAYRARDALFQGRFDEAERFAMELLSTGTPLERGRVTARAGMVLYLARRERGRLDELEAGLHGFARQYPNIPAWICSLALLHVETGKPGEARSILERFGSRPVKWCK